ncbi:hypothetical protein [Caballeronia sp. Sq4a]|jgi:hypothetical protein|nr:hypothetical protein [Caballeronia sp. Sq4a]
MSPFFLIDVAALTHASGLRRNSQNEVVPTTILETLARLLTSLFH